MGNQTFLRGTERRSSIKIARARAHETLLAAWVLNKLLYERIHHTHTHARTYVHSPEGEGTLCVGTRANKRGANTPTSIIRPIEDVTEKKIEHLIKESVRPSGTSSRRNVQLVWRFRLSHTPHSGAPRARARAGACPPKIVGLNYDDTRFGYRSVSLPR